eukprot:3801528-Rhodomonas_salina.1
MSHTRLVARYARSVLPVSPLPLAPLPCIITVRLVSTGERVGSIAYCVGLYAERAARYARSVLPVSPLPLVPLPCPHTPVQYRTSRRTTGRAILSQNPTSGRTIRDRSTVPQGNRIRRTLSQYGMSVPGRIRYGSTGRQQSPSHVSSRGGTPLYAIRS